MPHFLRNIERAFQLYKVDLFRTSLQRTIYILLMFGLTLSVLRYFEDYSLKCSLNAL